MAINNSEIFPTSPSYNSHYPQRNKDETLRGRGTQGAPYDDHSSRKEPDPPIKMRRAPRPQSKRPRSSSEPSLYTNSMMTSGHQVSTTPPSTATNPLLDPKNITVRMTDVTGKGSTSFADHPLKINMGTWRHSISIQDQGLREAITEKRDQLGALLNKYLATKKKSEWTGFRYEMNYKRFVYKNEDAPGIQALKVEDTDEFKEISACIRELEGLAEQALGESVQARTHNKETVTLYGGRPIFTKDAIGAPTLQTLSKQGAVLGMRSALKRFKAPLTKGSQKRKVARNKIENAISKWHFLVDGANTQINRIENDLEFLEMQQRLDPPTEKGAAQIIETQRKLQGLKDYEQNLQELDGFAMGMAILHNDTSAPVPRFDTIKKTGEEIGKGIERYCERQDEHPTTLKEKASYAFSNMFNKSCEKRTA